MSEPLGKGGSRTQTGPGAFATRSPMTNDSDAPQVFADVAEVGPVLCMLVYCGWQDVHQTAEAAKRRR